MFKPDKTRFMFFEAVTTIFWFACDSLWLDEQHRLGDVTSLLVVLTSILAIVYAERNLIDIAIGIGTLSWVMMGIFWRIGDVYDLPSALVAAQVCKFTTVACLIAIIGVSRKARSIMESMKKFGRMRVK